MGGIKLSMRRVRRSKKRIGDSESYGFCYGTDVEGIKKMKQKMLGSDGKKFHLRRKEKDGSGARGKAA